MTEANDGRIKFIEEPELKDLQDRTLLTGLEHKILGSEPDDLRMVSYPRMPQVVLSGSSTIKDVNDARKAQVWFAATSIVAELGGMECFERYIALIKLSEIDPISGELEELPHLFGFFDTETGETLTVEDNLDDLPISPAIVNTYIAKKVTEMYQAIREAAS